MKRVYPDVYKRQLRSIEAHIVYENDEFEYELGLEPKLKHVPAMKNKGKIAWVYAVYKLNSGGFGFEVMSKEDIEEHKEKYSKAAQRGFSPWKNSWEEMAKKTVIKKALKYAPLKTCLLYTSCLFIHTISLTSVYLRPRHSDIRRPA